MPRHRKHSEDFHFVDIHVGKVLRFRREQLGISRQRLGQAAGVVHQQVEKYEGAINRVSPGCLYRFAPAYFFEALAMPAAPGPEHGPPRRRLSAPGNQGSHQGLLRDQRPPPPRHPSLHPVDERNVAISNFSARRSPQSLPPGVGRLPPPGCAGVGPRPAPPLTRGAEPAPFSPARGSRLRPDG